jgi:hypothetical protein
MSSKLIHQQKEFFSKMVVDAVMMLDDLLPLNMIGIKKVQGGALEDTVLVPGVAFKKTFSYAGFEMQRKAYKNPKIALLNIELELKAEKDNAEVSDSGAGSGRIRNFWSDPIGIEISILDPEDPKLLAGSGSHPELKLTFRIRIRIRIRIWIRQKIPNKIVKRILIFRPKKGSYCLYSVLLRFY